MLESTKGYLKASLNLKETSMELSKKLSIKSVMFAKELMWVTESQ